MKHLVQITALAFIFSLPVFEAGALLPKADPGGAAAEGSVIPTEVTKLGGKVQEYAGAVKEIKARGEGFKSYKNKFDKARKRFEAEKKGFNEIKDTLTSEYQNANQFYSAEKAKLDAKTKSIKARNKLKEEKEVVESTHTSDVTYIQVNAQAAKDNIDSNSKIYQELIKERPEQSEQFLSIIADNNKRKLQIEEDAKAQIATLEEGKNQKLSDINAQIKVAEQEIFELGLDVGESVGKSLFSLKKVKAKDANSKTADKLFLPKGVVSTPENNDALRVSRSIDSLEASIDAYSQSLQSKIKSGPTKDSAQNIQDTATLLEPINDAQSQNTMAKLEQAKIVIDIIRLKSRNLQAETSGELRTMSVYTRNYESDQGTLDLCNYRRQDKKKGVAK